MFIAMEEKAEIPEFLLLQGPDKIGIRDSFILLLESSKTVKLQKSVYKIKIMICMKVGMMRSSHRSNGIA